MHPGDIRKQLRRILASSLFHQSPKLSAFLEYVVETTLAGAPDSLKEYSIGVEVFDRGNTFDPRIDNIVRIQAAKLRTRLLEYYATAPDDPIVITIPKGAYAPEIRPRETSSPPPPAPDASLRNRIAVLPFVNMSSDSENEYFSDGLTEEIINRLACLPSLQVVARTSVFSFKGRHLDLREVGRQLNVTTVLEGSVRKAGDQLRVTAQLIDVETGFHLFSRTYHRQFREVFDLQDELAQSVAREIAPTGMPAYTPAVRTGNLDAYNAYLRGMYAASTRFSDLDSCIGHFRDAIALDPNYAPAWAGLALGYFLLAWFYRSAPDVAVPLSREAALKSLALDPDSALGMHLLATAECALEWQWASAETRFKRAIQLQPSLTIGHVEYALFCLVPHSRFDEATLLINQALAIDPFNPLLHAVAVHVYGQVGRYEDAARQFATAVSIAPSYPPIHAAMGLAQEWNGHLQAAVETYRTTCTLSGDAPFPLSCLAHALARTGDREAALALLARLRAGKIVAPTDVARVYCGLRDLDQTLHYLEEAARTRCLYLMRSIADPRFDWLLTEPRYCRILHSMGLPTA